jgi:hypothetical protein
MEPEPPFRHIGFHQLFDAMRQPGCPICRVASWAIHRLLDSLFHGHVNDPGMREELRRATGFCARHLGSAFRAGNPLGGSIIYGDLARHVADHLDDKPPAACPCCVCQTTAAADAIATLLEHVQEEDVRATYQGGDGLCLPHLRQALSHRDAPGRLLLAQLERDKLNRLAEECETLVGKSDHEHIRDELGSERDAWKRTARKLSGD